MAGARRAVARLAGALLLAAAGGVTVAAGMSATGATAAAADPMGQCSTSTGVVVVVDLSPWGGTIERGCAADPGTGVAALHSAGFTTIGAGTYGTAFICRINGDPSATPCTGTPPANAYWALWTAGPGQGTWSYSAEGAESIRPQPGSVEAWTFGANRSSGQPPFSPAAVRATNTTPPTTTPSTPSTTVPPAPPTAPSGGGAGGSGPVSGGGTGPTPPDVPAVGTGPGSGGQGSAGQGSANGSGRTAPGGTPAGATGSAPEGSAGTAAGGGTGSDPAGGGGGGRAGSSTGAGSGSRPGGPRIVAAAPVNDRHPAGSALGFLVGLGMLVLAGAVAGLLVWRRRSLERGGPG